MTNLKKLFPLSFKFTKSPVNLLLGALIYSGIAAVGTYVLSTVLSMIFTPLMMLGMIPIIGWFIILPTVSAVYSILLSTVTFLVSAYAYAGIAVSLVAYAKAEEAAE